MNPILRQMAKTTFAELKERDALPKVSNGAIRRYAADYIVKKSPFSHFFHGLGITRGCQLKHSFDDIRAHYYLERIYMLYCLKWIYTFDPTLIPWMDNFDVSVYFSLPREELQEALQRVRIDYKNTLHDVREALDLSMGRNVAYKEQKLVDKQVLTQFCTMPDEDLLRRCSSTTGAECPAAALALLSRNLQSTDKAKGFIEERQDEIRHWFVRFASWRYYLAMFHNCQLIDTDIETVSNYYCNDGWVEQITGGQSHQQLNIDAVKWQRTLSRALRAIKGVQPLDDVEMINNVDEFEECRKHHRQAMKEAKPMDDDMFTAGDVTLADIPDEIKALAQRLSHIHGPVTVTTEASGMHLYVADPELVETDGEKELTSRHMSINVDKYFGLNAWDVDENPTKENRQIWQKYRSVGKEVPCCLSMKTGRRSSVAELLAYPPIEQRVPSNHAIEKKVFAGDQNKHLVYDEFGNLVPEKPGTCVPLSSLPKDHPAIEYLKRRGFDPDYLETVYGVSFCTEALPEDRSVSRYYSRLPAGVKNSPQQRIVFPIRDDKGVQRGWQARAIDYKDESGNRWLWTDKGNWLQIEKEGQDLFITEEDASGFKKLRKYLNPRGFNRNQAAFGLYQAILYTKSLPYEKRVCYLMEGPMDAARGGPPCIALLGKSMSDDQAGIIKAHFSKVVLVADNDTAGKEFVRCISKRLSDIPLEEAVLPPGKKDLGECTWEEAQKVLHRE